MRSGPDTTRDHLADRPLLDESEEGDVLRDTSSRSRERQLCMRAQILDRHPRPGHRPAFEDEPGLGHDGHEGQEAARGCRHCDSLRADGVIGRPPFQDGKNAAGKLTLSRR